jgi:hypothetical protein
MARVRFPPESRGFSVLHRVQTGVGAHPASYPMDTEECFKGVKRPRRETDYSPPSSAEAKNGGAVLSLPQTAS